MYTHTYTTAKYSVWSSLISYYFNAPHFSWKYYVIATILLWVHYGISSPLPQFTCVWTRAVYEHQQCADADADASGGTIAVLGSFNLMDWCVRTLFVFLFVLSSCKRIGPKSKSSNKEWNEEKLHLFAYWLMSIAETKHICFGVNNKIGIRILLHIFSVKSIVTSWYSKLNASCTRHNCAPVAIRCSQ